MSHSGSRWRTIRRLGYDQESGPPRNESMDLKQTAERYWVSGSCRLTSTAGSATRIEQYLPHGRSKVEAKTPSLTASSASPGSRIRGKGCGKRLSVLGKSDRSQL